MEPLHTLRVPGPVQVQVEQVGPTRGAPVLLVPGLAASPLPFVTHGQRSLATSLQGAGRTPWTADFAVSWRGRDQGATALLLGLEQAVAELSRHTGAPVHEIDAVGHSLGGILLLGLLADGLPLRRVVTLASGLDYSLGPSPLPRLLSLAPKGTRPLRLPLPGGGLPTRSLARLGAPLFGRGLGLPVERDQFHPGTSDTATIRAVLSGGVRDLPWPLLFDLAELFTAEGLHLGVGGYPLRAAVSRIDQPVLLVGAQEDRQCPIESVRDAAARIPRGSLLELGAATPAATGYGHLDLLCGRRAPEHVFDPLVAFLCDPADRL